MALKNAYSRKPIQNIFNDLQKNLVTHGAKQILFEYGEGGKATGLTFVIQLKDKYYPIKLPARLEKAKKVLQDQGFKYDDEQMYRVAWRNVEDWVAAQMAFIDLDQVKLEEVFLPHMTDQTGITYFERMEAKDFLLPEGRKNHEEK